MQEVAGSKKMKNEKTRYEKVPLAKLLREGRELREAVRVKYEGVRAVSEQKLSLRVD